MSYIISTCCNRLGASVKLKACMKTRNMASAMTDAVNRLQQLKESFAKDELEVESPFYFRNVSVVNPRTFSSFFYNNFKLKFIEPLNKTEKPGVELLRNIAANYDYWLVRNNQTHLLYYRMQMLQQRLDFLQSVGLTSKQKLRQIQKYPPLLFFTFTDCSYDAKLVYLRGLLPKANPKDYIHMFYPVTAKLTLYKDDVERNLGVLEAGLSIKRTTLIRELLNLPCFFMDPTMLQEIDHQFIHKYSMSFYFDRDKHTAPIFPPICNLQSLGLSVAKHLSNKSSNNDIASLPIYHINDVLDKSYPTNNGKGTPECLSTFLIQAELEEEKDRTGGQPMKGRRGFNVPPRQY